VRRRCSTCGASVQNKRCPKGHEGWSWSFTIDAAPPGAPRRQLTRSGFQTKREALEALSRLQEQLRAHSFVEPSKRSLGEYLAKWVEGLAAAGLAPSTVASYREAVELRVAPELGDVPLQGLEPSDLDRLYAKLLREGHRRKAGGLSPRTVRYTHTIIRKALADAMRKGLVVRNVADLASPPSAKAARPPEMRFWTPEQLGVFLSVVAGHRLFPLWRTAAFTGMRRGELAGLRWSDVDLEGDERAPGRIAVGQQYAGDGAGSFDFQPPKTEHGRRLIELDAETVRVLSRWRTHQLEERMMLGLGERAELVFTQPDGSPLRPDSGISAVFDRLLADIDLPRIRFHDLRHTHCAHLIASGADLKAVATRLGHASASFTLDRYGHLLPGQQAEAAARVARMVDGD
jgi:integrase